MRAILLALAVFFAATPALAHKAPSGWNYAALCCSNKDCAEIPDSAVRITSRGYEVTVEPHFHNMVTEPTLFVIPFDDKRVKASPDGKYHACVNERLELLCLYVGPQGS